MCQFRTVNNGTNHLHDRSPCKIAIPMMRGIFSFKIIKIQL